MADTSQEKTEEATPKKRLDARKKGTVAKSIDLTGAAVVVVLLMSMPSIMSGLAGGFSQSLNTSFERIPKDIEFASLYAFGWHALQPSLSGLGMLMAVAVVIGLASNVGQVGLKFSTEALTPRFTFLNPLNGLKRMMGPQGLFEAGKALAKSTLFGFIAYSVIIGSWGELINLGWLEPAAGLKIAGGIAKTMALRMAFFWLAIAALDYFVQKKRIDKQLKMTKEEVKQEMKDADQSPELKMAMMRARKRMKGRMRDEVKKADVIITNPTHFAVALEYDNKKSPAPIVVAKGADVLAFRIREIAKEHKIPIVPNPPLARALYKQCEVGDVVPGDLFKPVAEVLAYVYQTLGRIKR